MATATAQRRPRARPSRSGVRWDKVSRIALLGTLGVILLLYLSPAKHWLEQSATARDQTQQLHDLTQENTKLERRVATLKDPAALEAEARRLGMVREGERSYVIERR
ncbi:MAG: FtsB family cell division protein [Thermoleophilaceae bacterium]